MFFYVHQLRQKGILVPRHNIVRLPGTPGRFVLDEEHDRETMRRVRVARLLPLPNSSQSSDLLPPLVDATLIYAVALWTLTGFEREPAGGLAEPAHLQSWLMRPFTPEEAHEVLTDGMGAELGAQHLAGAG